MLQNASKCAILKEKIQKFFTPPPSVPSATFLAKGLLSGAQPTASKHWRPNFNDFSVCEILKTLTSTDYRFAFFGFPEVISDIAYKLDKQFAYLTCKLYSRLPYLGKSNKSFFEQYHACIWLFSLSKNKNKKAGLSQRWLCDAPYKTTSGYNSDHTVRQYAHGLLQESPFVPSSTDCWAVGVKIRQKRPSRWP